MKRFFVWLGAQWREFVGLDAAWEKIMQLDSDIRSTQADLCWKRHDAREHRDAEISSALLNQDRAIASLKTETENLRRLVTARKDEESAPPKVARTWREVQNFMGDTTDAPAS